MPSVRREVVLPVARERACEHLPGPEELLGWLAGDAGLDPRSGGEVRADDRKGVVEDVEAGRRLAFRWDDGEAASRVVWTLDDAPGGARVTVVERRLAPEASFARDAALPRPSRRALAPCPA